MSKTKIAEVALKEFERNKKVIEDGGEVVPHFIAMQRDGELAYIGAPWHDDESKRRIYQILKLVFAARDVVAYVLVSETWVATVDRKDDPRINVPPRDREDRREALTCLAVAYDGVTHFAGEIERFNGVTVKEPVSMEGETMSGNACDLLYPKDAPPLTPAQRDLIGEIVNVLVTDGRHN